MARIAVLTFLVLAVLGFTQCSYTQKVTDGATAYELRRYHEAIPLLEREYERTKSRVDRGKLAYMLGRSYDEQHQPGPATDWYRTAYDFQYGPEALEAYAEMLMQTERYEEALEAYKELGLEIGSRYQYRRQMQAAAFAMTFDPGQSRFEVGDPAFASEGATYAPSLIGDGVLLVSADATAAADDDVYAWTGRSYSDLYLQPLPRGERVPLGDRINGEYNEGAGAVSPDGRHLAFTRCAPLLSETGYCQIYVADREGDDWGEPQPLAFQEDEVNYVQPAWSQDGSLLYFSSDHPDGLGGYDLYTAERLPAGEWTPPSRLPRTINTSADEHFPSLVLDTLYFASEGHAGIGGLDIFRTYPLGGGAWAAPFNLLPPLNSGADDFGITFAEGKTPEGRQRGYFSSGRADGLDRIYTFAALPPPPPPVDTTEEEEGLPTWTLTVSVVEKVLSDPTDPDSRSLGMRPIETADVSVEPAVEVTEVEPGVFSLPLGDSADYRFLASAEGYINQDARFSTMRMQRRPGGLSQNFELEIELSRIYAGREIVLDDIYYDFDKSDIRDDAEPTLRKLARDLQLNPELRIRLGSHTDCQGADNYNLALSQRRAESAVAFLIEQGVSPERLQAVGYGEDVPRTDCACSRCTDDDHQLNRRTTFAVLENS